MLKCFAMAVAFGGLIASPAFAGTYNFSVVEGLSNGTGFDTTNVAPFTAGAPNVASATFLYTGNLDFSDTQGQNGGPSGDLNSAFGFSTADITHYQGSGKVALGATPVADFNSRNGFLGSSGSASGFQYGSYYAIDLGILAAGTVLDITHDDGVSVYQGATRIGNTVSGPTGKTEDYVTVGAAGDTFLYYSRQNGTPSILDVNVPEPASIAVLGMGLLGLTLMMRRRNA